jgi:hypothetical protein
MMGLILVSLVGLNMGSQPSAKAMMETLAEIKATQVRVWTKERGRRNFKLYAKYLTRIIQNFFAFYAD